MNPGRPPSPIRAMLYYSTAILLLTYIGSVVQGMLGLTGVVINELVIFLGLAVFFGVTVDWRPVRQLFRLYPLTAGGLIKTVMLGVSAWALAHLMGTLMVFLVERMGGHMYESHQVLTAAPYWLAMLTGALLPAIAEEMAFRGYVQWSLGPLGPRAAVVITGVLFGAMHLTLVRLLPLVLLGLIFSAAVQRTGSIFTSMIMHFLNNGILLTLSFFLTMEKPLPGLDPMPSDASWTAVLVLALALIPLGALVVGLLRSLGPWDVRREPAVVYATEGRVVVELQPAVIEGMEAAPVPVWKLMVALAPAVLVYVSIVAQELHVVFAH